MMKVVTVASKVFRIPVSCNRAYKTMKIAKLQEKLWTLRLRLHNACTR